MNRRVLIIIVLALVAVGFYATFVSPIFLGAGGDNLFKNGSFDNGNFTAGPGEPTPGDCGCKLLCGGSGSLNNWQISKPTSTSQDCDSANDAVAWLGVPNPFGIGPADGPRFLDLTGEAGRPPAQFGVIQQTIEGLVPGSTYELSLAIGSSSKFDPPKAPNTSQFYSLTVEAAGLPGGKQTFTATAPTPDLTHWDQHTLRFAANVPTMTFTFSASSSAGANGLGGAYVGIDNVSLRKVCFLGLFIGCR